MKVGDPVRAMVRNNAANAVDGVPMQGEITAINDTLVTFSTQFGIRVTLPVASVQAVNDGETQSP